MISTAREAMGPTVITMRMLETVMKMRTVCSTYSCGMLFVGNGMLRAPRGAMCESEVRGYTIATLHRRRLQDSGAHSER